MITAWRWLALALFGVGLFTGRAQAQKTCKKGIPCGNSCIAANKTCRIQSVPTANSTSDAAATASRDGAWVGSTIGHTYYRAGCSGARKLKPSNLRTFASEAEAQKAGYAHSGQRGC